MEFPKNQQGKYAAITMVKTFFNASMQEMKELSSKDRIELASGIARTEQIPTADLGFELVPY